MSLDRDLSSTIYKNERPLVPVGHSKVAALLWPLHAHSWHPVVQVEWSSAAAPKHTSRPATFRAAKEWQAEGSRSLAGRHDQRDGPVADGVRPARGTARVEIKIDAELAEPRDFDARPRVGHAMDHAQ